MTATLIQELVDPDDTIYAVSQGNMEVLPSGHTVLGYGSVPTMKEFDAAGNVVLSVSWGAAKAVQSYRDTKAEWVGRPSASPNVFACKGENGTDVYMSWNGATQHKTWTVFGDVVNGILSEILSVEKNGFETRASTKQELSFVKVEASAEGEETGVSDVVGVIELC